KKQFLGTLILILIICMYCNVIQGGEVMPIISLRMNEDEEKLIKEYAEVNNISILELLRSSVLEKIENDIDLNLYHQAVKEHEMNPSDISFEDMVKELNLPQ